MKGHKRRAYALRTGRVSIPGQIYMITTVTHRREPIFSDFRLGRSVVSTLRDASSSAETLAYVVMPDHLHWLMQLKEGQELSSVIRFVKGRSARRINSLRERSGSVWAKGYFDQALRAEDDLKDFARYIVANPLRAGLVRSVGDYPLWDAIWLGR